MLARKSLRMTVAMVISGMLCMAVEARANPSGVPVPQPVPTTCTTPSFTITAKVGPNNEFPQAVPCNSPSNAGKQCAKYVYDISSLKNIARTVVAVAADQDLDSTNPASPPTGVYPPGAGDPATKFLANAVHEYAVAFTANSSKSTRVEVIIVGPSTARLSTILVKGAGSTPSSSSKKDERGESSGGGEQKVESCLIAGPGVPGDPFQPMSVTKTDVVAGGKCVARLIYDGNGKLVNVTTDPPCVTYSGPVSVNGQPLQNNTGPTGITFGNGTTTCYGPPVPSPARCICTRAPCP